MIAGLALVSCYAREGEPAAAAEPDFGQPVQFTFGTLDGTELSSDTTRGRTTALLFVTTYDLPSQAEAQLLGGVLATHKPLANAAIVMMEPPHSAPLAQVWADSIGLKLPVAMATPSLLAGDSQLGRVAGVPTLIVLDRRGRLVAKNEGALTREQISECLARADKL
ncbi:MAG TPA: TlpA family protein disulfide reductase [Polyangiaceae bacterium]|nr:TlpA family protein disulfide reductase [Polyangiaceae bacterium]